jgi:hypothetical protein
MYPLPIGRGVKLRDLDAVTGSAIRRVNFATGEVDRVNQVPDPDDNDHRPFGMGRGWNL